MINNKVLFFDIDGTLLNPSTHKIEQTTMEILEELSKRKDIDMYISTGRSRTTIKEMNPILPYFKGLNLCNGSQIIIDNKIMYTVFFKEDEVIKLLSYLEEQFLSYSLVTSDDVFSKFYSPLIEEAFNQAVKTNYIKIDSFKNIKLNNIIEIWILAENSIIDKIVQIFPFLTIYYWGNSGCDVVVLNQSKALGIKKIIEIMGYNQENTFAFGDSDNDVPMFKAVNTSIAMGKSTPMAIKAATYQTLLLEDAGLAKAVKKYVLKKSPR